MSYTIQEINKMNSETYKEKFNHEPGFAEFVNSLEFNTKDARDRQSTQRSGYQPAEAVVRYDEEGREIEVPAIKPPQVPVAESEVQPIDVAQPPTEEVPVVAPVVTEVEEKVHQYQPTDEAGTPIGGVQRIKYKTTEELIEKLTKNHSESIKGMRNLVKNARLGITEEVKEEIPETAPRYTEADDVVRFTEADFPGLVPAVAKQKASALNRNQDETIQNRALLEANAFTAAEPRYVRSNENMGILCNWLVKNNLKPVRSNFQLAFNTLVDGGILLLPPTKREEATVPSAAPVANSGEISPAAPAVSRITEPAVAPVKRPVAGVGTGLTDNNSSHAEPITRDPLVENFRLEVPVRDEKGKVTGQVRVYKGLEALDKMPSEEYKMRYNANPAEFMKQVDAVEKTRRRSKNAR